MLLALSKSSKQAYNFQGYTHFGDEFMVRARTLYLILTEFRSKLLSTSLME